MRLNACETRVPDTLMIKALPSLLGHIHAPSGCIWETCQCRAAPMRRQGNVLRSGGEADADRRPMGR